MTTLTLGASAVPSPPWRPTLSPRPRLSRTAVGAVAALAVAGWMVWKLRASAPMALPEVTSWRWAGLALGACAASFAAGAAVLTSVSPVRVPAAVAFSGQLAAAATKLVTPSSFGLVGLNARLLHTHGTPLPYALAAVGASQLAQLLLTLGALAIVLPAADVVPVLPAPSPTVLWAGAALAVAVCGAALLGRRHLAARGAGMLRAVRPLGVILRSPWRISGLVVGCLALTGTLTLSLWASVRALGGEASLVTVAVVLLVGSAVGSAVPTPGGVGGVEGAMVAAFVATGLGADVALSGVLMFRLVTFWLPVPLGATALLWLRRTGRL